MALCGGIVIDNKAFKRNFSLLLQKAGAKAEMVVRKTALELQSSMVERSPVDTGRFRGNWQCGIGQMNAGTSDAPNSDAIGRTALALSAWTPGKTIWLTNSMPYSYKLEHGHSAQAPFGMVKLTVQNYATALAEAVRSIQ